MKENDALEGKRYKTSMLPSVHKLFFLFPKHFVRVFAKEVQLEGNGDGFGFMH